MKGGHPLRRTVDRRLPPRLYGPVGKPESSNAGGLAGCWKTAW